MIVLISCGHSRNQLYRPISKISGAKIHEGFAMGVRRRIASLRLADILSQG